MRFRLGAQPVQYPRGVRSVAHRDLRVVWCSRRIEAGEASDPGSGRGAPGEGFGFSSRRDGKPLKKVASDSQKNNTACA